VSTKPSGFGETSPVVTQCGSHSIAS